MVEEFQYKGLGIVGMSDDDTDEAAGADDDLDADEDDDLDDDEDEDLEDGIVE